ncbi:efflux RND transporter periplasmic adaptor subunit [Phormidium pseudopriestleyi FRX01]|uniref:Efflux RND transporter periplasmic adaptor subunit n=1 Tax=Phormidium pseudopriestleyi FRX01 TaxID=1759528 RepID=A0ABS3FS57_9CYAN|nr:efflux RND transporter periplasmic adaptor subunit [Phormidium pseudopriestleyi]MBO0349953.1 efflux RND transporter periplasmic adaptor subunit [Phormidium pseudopriestleyi FRX01]
MKKLNPSNSQLETEEKAISVSHETELERQQDKPLRDKKRRFKWASRRGRSLASVLFLLLLIAGGGTAWYFWQSHQTAVADSEQQAAPQRPQGVAVRLATVEMTNLRETSEFVGTLEARQAAVVRPEMAGRVSQINVKAGDKVSRGDMIARIDTREIEARLRQAQAAQARAQARVAELQAGSRPEEIAQGEARLAAAEARLAEVRAGTRPEEIAQAEARLRQAQARLAELRAGSRPEEIAQAETRLQQARSRLESLRNGSRGDEIAQAQAQIADAQARVELTKERVERNRELADQGAISRDRFDEVVTENRRAQADLQRFRQRVEQLENLRLEEIVGAELQVTEAQQALAQLESGARPEEIAQAQAQVAEAQQLLNQRQNGARPEEIARAEAEVEETRQGLRQLENGTRPEEIDQAQAQVAEAIAQVRALEVQLQDANIVAPFEGIVGDIPAKVGDVVSVGQELTTLTQNDALELRLSIPLERGSELRLGMPVEITDANGEPLSRGTVSFVSPRVNSDSQTILAKARFANQGQLRDRQFVRAKLVWNERDNRIVVPTTAITFQGEERFIFVARGEDPATVERVSVTLGLVQGDRSEVIEGLVNGDRIVISGLQRLSDGAQIRPIVDEPAPANPESSPPAAPSQ